jgi:hypothetical protein
MDGGGMTDFRARIGRPDFIKRWQAGAWPHFPVVGIDL